MNGVTCWPGSCNCAMERLIITYHQIIQTHWVVLKSASRQMLDVVWTVQTFHSRKRHLLSVSTTPLNKRSCMLRQALAQCMANQLTSHHQVLQRPLDIIGSSSSSRHLSRCCMDYSDVPQPQAVSAASQQMTPITPDGLASAADSWAKFRICR